MNTTHLDIGCGDKPRNPYRADKLFGIDIRPNLQHPKAEIRGSDLFRQPIPFESNFFDSVSAYDFLEHVPRVAITNDFTRFPFIETMNEVWRVLKDNGLFYASTPIYPHPFSFCDPTHVNILTWQTHLYFTRPLLMGKMYGFIGDFECIRVAPVLYGELEYQPILGSKNLIQKIDRKRREWWMNKTNTNSHVVWEFRAIKSVEAGTESLK